jgi:polyadenylate-binding protein
MNGERTVLIRNLPPGVNVQFLRELFREVDDAQASKIRIRTRTDRHGHRSKVAAVQFDSIESALRIIGDLNYTKLDGQAITLTRATPEILAILRSDSNKILLQNLDRSVEGVQLYEALSNFGEIVFCRIPTDEHGISRGYGYAQFLHMEDAQQAIDDLHEASINGRRFYVREARPRTARRS